MERAEVSLIARVRPVRSTIDFARRIPPMGVAVVDTSLAGLSFITDYEFAVDDVVEVELSRYGAELFLYGSVRHVNAQPGSGGLLNIGLQFIITPSTKHAVHTLREWLGEFLG